MNGRWQWDSSSSVTSFPSPPWTPLVDRVDLPLVDLSVALPCVGLDACGRALHSIGVEYRPVLVYDIAEALREPLELLYGETVAANFNLGGHGADLQFPFCDEMQCPP